MTEIPTRIIFENMKFSRPMAGVLTTGVFASLALNAAPLDVTERDRVLVLAPHPDDETLGAGGVIQKAVSLKIPVKAVFFTHGDNYEMAFIKYKKRPVLGAQSVRRMGELRRKEAETAAEILGLSPRDLIFLGYPDRGTMKIWRTRWAAEKPFYSAMTNADAVPYKNTFRPGAKYKGEEILKDLKTLIGEFRPTKIFVSHPGDIHGDHRSLALFTDVALWDLEDKIRPEVFPYLIHYKNWPKPKGDRPEIPWEPPPVFKNAAWREFPLSSEMLETKRKALMAHKTQFGYESKYLSSFLKPTENFGYLPAMVLERNAELPPVLSVPAEEAARVPEDLEGKAPSSFIGFEENALAMKNGVLSLRLVHSKPTAEGAGISVYIFGYRKDVPFGRMPKIRVSFGLLGYKVFDKLRPLPKNSIVAERKGRVVTLKIPLALLGDPDKILHSARSYFADVPLDWAFWRVLELKKENKIP